MARYSTHFQRTHSFLTGGERERPIHPIRRDRGVIHIGNRRIEVAMPRYWTQEELEHPVAHHCAAMDLNEVCTH